MKRLFPLLVLACTALTEPADDWIEFAPPAWYGDVWDEMIDCTGLHGATFDDVRWFRVERAWLDWNGKRCMGLSFVRDHYIVLAGCWADDPWTVAHEIIHQLAQDADPGHVGPYDWTCPDRVVDPNVVRICLTP